MDTQAIENQLTAIFHQIVYDSSGNDDFTEIYSLLDEMREFVREYRLSYEPFPIALAKEGAFDF